MPAAGTGMHMHVQEECIRNPHPLSTSTSTSAPLVFSTANSKFIDHEKIMLTRLKDIWLWSELGEPYSSLRGDRTKLHHVVIF